MRRALQRLSCILLLCGVIPGAARAQDAAAETPTLLEQYYTALSERRLVDATTGTDVELDARLRRGEDLAADEQWDAAALVLFELVESPRYRDFDGSDSYRHAEFLLAGALQEMGAYRTAYRYLARILSRGSADPYFGPAYRRSVDIALEGADLNRILGGLELIGEGDLSPDALNELRYLRGRARYDAGDLPGADTAFSAVGRRSRFYANAQYLRGVIATRAGNLPAAEALFCSIASTEDSERFTFYVDARYFEIRDLTWLALGRVAHEGERTDDAFYYYFQVPNDSERVAEALFEAAWSMYEGGDHDTAIDLLDQLQTRFPGSPFVDEAALLRGYVHLGRCEFEEADALFVAFASTFEPLREEVERILASPARRDRIVEELLDAELRREEARARGEVHVPGEGEVVEAPDLRETLLGLLHVDPTFFRIWSEMRLLDAESARAASVSDQLGAIGVRMRGGDEPEAAVETAGSDADTLDALERDVVTARAAARALSDQLDAMRAAGASREQLEPLETEVRTLAERASELEGRVREARSGYSAFVASTPTTDFENVLEEDRRSSSRFVARAAELRGRMLTEANTVAVHALETLRNRLGRGLRQARIGRIDAVMGSKRRIEIQIESLAAGRFPPELMDPLRIQGLLRDDEEYWPFEGEMWEDEYEEDDSGEETDADLAEDDSFDPEISDEELLDEESTEGDDGAS
jgi:hypothetical protein